MERSRSVRGGSAIAALALGLLATGFLITPAAADHDGLHVPVTDFLPPIAPDVPAPERVEECGDDGLACVRFVEAQLAGWEEYFGCDHRAVFPTVYRLLTHEIRLVLEDDPSLFDDPAGLGWESLLFYRLYEDMITAQLAGDPIPRAWQVAMDVATEGDHTGGHDMILGINAHVQRDMPFALAATGIVMPDGESRKPDHDRVNEILSHAYDVIVQEVGERYDPVMLVIDGDDPIDDLASAQLVQLWREGVWRNAERLVATQETALFELTVESIEQQAYLSAVTMTAGEVPGHRAFRDAYCAQQAAARAEASSDTGGLDTAEDPVATAVGTQTTAMGRPVLPATGGSSVVASLVLLGSAVLLHGIRRRP